MTAPPVQSPVAERKAALEGFLAEAAQAKSVDITALVPLRGGAIQENWLIDLDIHGGPHGGRQEAVLRTDAASSLPASHSRVREFALLKAAYAAGVTAPEPLWLCEDAAMIGRPFYVMRRARGTAAGHRLVKDNGPVRDREGLAERLGQELARIHSIRPPRSDLDFLARPRPTPAGHAIATYRRYLDEIGHPQPALEWGLRWCETHPVQSDQIVLVHQDFRTGNYMVDEGGLTAILDWEFCAWGDPLSDIGWFCAKCWRFGRIELEAGGIAGRESFYRGYEGVSGRHIDRAAVSFWEIMAHLRWGVIALQQGARFNVAGETSLDLALAGRVRPAELNYEVLAHTPPERWGRVDA